MAEYASGKEMWQDYSSRYGETEAFEICSRYLKLTSMPAKEQAQFNVELRDAMLRRQLTEPGAKRGEGNVSKRKIFPSVYRNNFVHAKYNEEIPVWRQSNTMNKECVEFIDKAIRVGQKSAGMPGAYTYDVAGAMHSAVEEYGFDRVNFVIAQYLQAHEHDGRYSSENKAWAQEFQAPQEVRPPIFMTHASVIDGFITCLRKEYEAQRINQDIPVEPIPTPQNEQQSATPYQQAHDVIADIERNATRFGNEERNLIVNFAFHVHDMSRVVKLAKELAEARFELQHGYADPKVVTRVNTEISAAQESEQGLSSTSTPEPKKAARAKSGKPSITQKMADYKDKSEVSANKPSKGITSPDRDDR